MKDYNNSKSNYKREEILKLKFPFYLVLGSLRSGKKWILFFVDQVNVKLLQNFSLQITDGAIQLLTNKISTRFEKTWTQQVCVEELNSFLMPIFLS